MGGRILVGVPQSGQRVMGDKSAIEWTDATWNPVTGCTKISPGCKHCYAERMAKRLQAMGQPNYAGASELTLHQQAARAAVEVEETPAWSSSTR